MMRCVAFRVTLSKTPDITLIAPASLGTFAALRCYLFAPSGCIAHFNNSGETIASSRDGLNILVVLMSLMAFAKGFSQRRDRLCQICLFDKRLRPDLPHQLILRNYMPTVLDQDA